jgi:hypothetical protein
MLKTFLNSGIFLNKLQLPAAIKQQDPAWKGSFSPLPLL